jgi:chaperonin cofactor prefoldin
MPIAPQSPRSGLGDAIERTVQQTVNNALSQARAGIDAQIAQLQSERASTQILLDHSSSQSVKRELQSKIDELDTRIAKLQRASEGIETKTRIATTTPPPTAPGFPIGDNFNPAPMVIAIVTIIFVGFPLSLAFARLLWRRATVGAAPAAALTQEQARRFDRLEQSVDAIAIEIERISENQRYLTKVLSEPKQNASVGAGQSH